VSELRVDLAGTDELVKSVGEGYAHGGTAVELVVVGCHVDGADGRRRGLWKAGRLIYMAAVIEIAL
jgi:hypothetical protein